MNALVLMVPAAVGLALAALGAFLWSLRSGQFDDPAGDAVRILVDDDHPG